MESHQKLSSRSFRRKSNIQVNGGTGSFAAGGGAAGTAEAVKGEIVVNDAGANFFAFSKNTFISS
jgi:hypothetical protein